MSFFKINYTKQLNESFVSSEGNQLELKFELVNNFNQYYVSHETKKYKINGEIDFQMRIVSVLVSKGADSNFGASPERTLLNSFYVRGLDVGKTGRYKSFKMTSEQLQTFDRSLDMSNDQTWRLIAIGSQSLSPFIIDVHVILEENPPTTSFVNLYDDTKLTDFELRGVDGAVSVHRAVLAAASPVLKNMLEGTWKETTDGGVTIPDTTRDTLQLLKQYLYLNILPEKGVENLLLLASCYMIDDLKEKCELALVSSLTAKNVLARTQFAVENAMTELHVKILERVQAGDISVEDIRRSLNINN